MTLHWVGHMLEIHLSTETNCSSPRSHPLPVNLSSPSTFKLNSNDQFPELDHHSITFTEYGPAARKYLENDSVSHLSFPPDHGSWDRYLSTILARDPQHCVSDMEAHGISCLSLALALSSFVPCSVPCPFHRDVRFITLFLFVPLFPCLHAAYCFHCIKERHNPL